MSEYNYSHDQIHLITSLAKKTYLHEILEYVDFFVGFMACLQSSSIFREVIDLVLIHELCHLLVMDHSARFKLLMDRALPDWRRREVLLSGCF